MSAAPHIILGSFAIGLVIRLCSGTPVLRTDLVMRADQETTAPSGTPEAVVVSFYDHLAKGEYQKAWELSIEPVWKDAREATYRDAVGPSATPEGWTPEAGFMSRCSADIGEGLKLSGIGAVPLSGPPDSPEARAAAACIHGRLAGVHVSGQMLGACLIYHWDRDLAVAEIDGRYRVVLPGTKAAKSFFHEAWFSNVVLTGSLRAADQ